MLYDTHNYIQKPRVFWGRPTTFRWHTQGYCTYFGLCRDPGLCCSMSQRIHQRPSKQGLPSCCTHCTNMNETTTCDTPVDEPKEMNPEVVGDDEGDQMDEASCFMNGHGSHRTSI